MLCRGALLVMVLACSHVLAAEQAAQPAPAVTVTVVDENGLPVSDARITLSQPGPPPVELQTRFAGRCVYSLHEASPYRIQAQKPGFYQVSADEADASRSTVEVK